MSKSTLNTEQPNLKKELFNAFRRKRRWVPLTLNSLETLQAAFC